MKPVQLRGAKCGLYEASDLLLGDHLCGKSQTVVWINASMPHNRKRRYMITPNQHNYRSATPIQQNYLRITPLTRSILKDSDIWRTFASTSLLPSTQSPVSMLTGILCTASSPNMCYPITKSTIQTRRGSERTTTTLSSSCLSIFAMRETSSRKERMLNVLSIGTYKINTSINTHSQKLQQMLKSKECVEKINEARQAQEDNAG